MSKILALLPANKLKVHAYLTNISPKWLSKPNKAFFHLYNGGQYYKTSRKERATVCCEDCKDIVVTQITILVELNIVYIL